MTNRQEDQFKKFEAYRNSNFSRIAYGEKKLYKTFQWVNLHCHLRIEDCISIPTAKTNVWTAYRIIKDAIEDCSLYSHSWTEGMSVF